MRDTTLEEQKSVQENIDKISRPTRVNFWELLEEHNNKELLKGLQEQYNKCWELYSNAFDNNMNDNTRNALSQKVATYMPDIMQMFGYLIDEMEHKNDR